MAGHSGFKYPDGIYSDQSPPGYAPYQKPNDEYQRGSTVGDDPSYESDAYLQMSVRWQPIDVVIGGTYYLRYNAEHLLPREPAELEDAWMRRVSHATMSPYTVRIAEQAAGLILRKPITLEPKGEGAGYDEYWDDFVEDVDGHGTSVSAFVRRMLVSSFLYGHAGIMVDYPTREAAPSLQAERLAGMRPYLLDVDAKQILGWRFDEEDPMSAVQQVRINEYVSVPFGEFGDRTIRQVRVLEPGRYRVFRREADRDIRGGGGDEGWYIHEEGEISLDMVPLAITYTQKLGEFLSTPPLLAVANLNISHAQRNADLQHSLHVAAMPILVLKGFDENSDPIGLSVNNAILLPPEGDAMMVEPASSSFDSQMEYLDKLEEQMSALGVSTLMEQKSSAETAEAKRLSRTDSDSMLAIVSRDVEGALQRAMDMAGEYVGIEAPKVRLDRDFDTQVLDGSQVSQYLSLYTNNAITHETLLQALKRGEVLPDLDVESEVELVDQARLDSMMMDAAPDMAAPTADSEGDEEIQASAVERMRRIAAERPGQDDNDQGD